MRPVFLSLIAVLILVLGISAVFIRGDTTPRVLFIGNSLTATNNLPGMVASIARSQGNRMIYDVHAPGGTRLKDHADNRIVSRKMGEENWDYVVLQGQSLLSALSSAYVTANVPPYAARLVAGAREANPDTSVIFYMTMAYRDGSPRNQRFSPELATYAGMQRRLSRSYVSMAQGHKALVAPVGEAWAIVRRARPDLALYIDQNHPNPTGYLPRRLRLLRDALSKPLQWRRRAARGRPDCRRAVAGNRGQCRADLGQNMGLERI